MAQTETSSWLNFALQQMAAESYLDGIVDLTDDALVRPRLLSGNNRPGSPLLNYTRFTEELADRFLASNELVHQHANDASGFSATLIHERDQNGQLTSNFTLSFRSTEYRSQSQGGDYERDGANGLLGTGADGEIASKGFAFAQLLSMELYYRELKNSGALSQNAVLNVTGYSLGGHLATVFTELHAAEINHTYTFNGAGRGHIFGGPPVPSEVERIRGMLDLLETRLSEIDPNWHPFANGNIENIYTDARYMVAIQSVLAQYTTTIPSVPPGEPVQGPGFDKVTQLYGHATSNDTEYVANLGVHASATSIFIEDQPDLDGFGGVWGLSGDFGTTHSIILMVDSLALTELFQSVTPTLDRSVIDRLFAASSSERASGFVGIAGTVEATSLERALDALRKIFTVGMDDPITNSDSSTGGFGNITNRNEFYDHINQVKNLAASGLFTIDSLVDMRSSSILSQARNNSSDGMAYRYAVRELIPFAVRGVDYGVLHNQGAVESRPLDLYDAQTGRGTWTALALSDRAELLAKRIQFNVADGGTVQTDTHYVDLQTGFEVGTTSSISEVIFGDDRVGDVLVGHAGNDHLYGRDGADTIEGNDGNDYIEGGLGTDPRLSGGAGNDILLGQQGDDQLYGEADNDRLNGGLGDDLLDGGTGLDTYFYRTGQGQDRIIDSDKIGTILFDNQTLVGGIRRQGTAADTWVSPDGTFTYVKSGTYLVINGALTIENFDFTTGALGIKLASEAAYGETTRTEFLRIDHYETNPIPGGNPIPIYAPFFDETANDTRNVAPIGGLVGALDDRNNLVHAGGGNDTVLTGAGDDEVYGDGGEDLLAGFGGNDRLYGGADNDTINGDDSLTAVSGNDCLDGGSEIDLLKGGPGQDVLSGGAGDDGLDGEDGDDVLWGGDGNDLLSGESGDRAASTMGNDYLNGEAGDDWLLGYQGDDVLYGATGADHLYGDQEPVEVPNFRLDYPGIVTIVPGGIFASVTGGADHLDGGDGNDYLQGDAGDDVLFGGADNDQLWGDDQQTGVIEEGDDWLEGEGGNDQFVGGGGEDALFGGDGDDVLVGDYANNPTLGFDDTLDEHFALTA